MSDITNEQLAEYRRRVEAADAEIGEGVVLGPVWMDYVAEIANPATVLQLVDAIEESRRTNAEVADLLDRVVTLAVRVAIAVPANSYQCASDGSDLIAIAEEAARMSSDLTPETAPGAGDSLHAPGAHQNP